MNSMTAYARSQGSWMEFSWTWEVKSVNHRFLDQFYRLPESYRRLESQLRPLVGQKLKRGRVEIFLQVKRHDEQVINQINTTLLEQLLELSDKIATNYQIAKRLDISESTVKMHIGIVFKKYAVQDRSQLIFSLKRKKLVNQPILEYRFMNTTLS